MITQAALLGNRDTVEREERILATSGEGSDDQIAMARALPGDHDPAFTLALEQLSAARLMLPDYFDHLPEWGLEGLTRHPRFPELQARYKKAQQELLARYPID